VHIEAAAFHGKPIEFYVLSPWTRPWRMTPFVDETGRMLGNDILAVLLLAALGGGVFFARRNLRLGRGDRRGAMRLSLFIFTSLLLGWIVGEHHVSSVWELAQFLGSLSGILFVTCLVWVLYVALEPFVRRRWPQILVSWTRVLSGEWRDPLVGRDVLVGCASGIMMMLLIRVAVATPSWLGLGNATPYAESLAPGLGSFLQFVFRIGVSGPLVALCFLFTYFLLRMMLRREWAATVAYLLILSAGGPIDYLGDVLWSFVLFNLILNALLLVILMRVGLTVAVVYLFVAQLMGLPITFHTSSWYFGIGAVALFIVAALTFYGFHTALGGRRLVEIVE